MNAILNIILLMEKIFKTNTGSGPISVVIHNAIAISALSVKDTFLRASVLMLVQLMVNEKLSNWFFCMLNVMQSNEWSSFK